MDDVFHYSIIPLLGSFNYCSSSHRAIQQESPPLTSNELPKLILNYETALSRTKIFWTFFPYSLRLHFPHLIRSHEKQWACHAHKNDEIIRRMHENGSIFRFLIFYSKENDEGSGDWMVSESYSLQFHVKWLKFSIDCVLLNRKWDFLLKSI